MIEISVTTTPIVSGVSAQWEGHKHIISQSYQNIMSFFQDCVDANIILNVALMDDMASDEQDITCYYATTVANAEEFIRRWQDTSAVFSMGKFWADAGFQTVLSHREIDFNTIVDTLILVDKNRAMLWGWNFPI